MRAPHSYPQSEGAWRRRRESRRRELRGTGRKGREQNLCEVALSVVTKWRSGMAWPGTPDCGFAH